MYIVHYFKMKIHNSHVFLLKLVIAIVSSKNMGRCRDSAVSLKGMHMANHLTENRRNKEEVHAKEGGACPLKTQVIHIR